MQIGSANSGWGHFINSANIAFYFNRSVHVEGDIYKYGGNRVQYVPSVLYNNSSGTTGTASLSASLANYNHMRVYFRCSQANNYSSVDTYSPNGKPLSAFIIRNATHDNSKVQASEATYGVSATSIWVVSGSQSEWGSWTGISSGNIIAITRVEAWNE